MKLKKTIKTKNLINDLFVGFTLNTFKTIFYQLLLDFQVKKSLYEKTR